MPSRRTLLSTGLAALLALPATAALAHHGWSWTTGGHIEVTGVVKEARLGNPHGILILDVEGEDWTAEVGQPWRNQRAGLTDDKLQPGAEVTIVGEPASDPEEHRVKAIRVTIDGTHHDLYPERLGS